MMQTLKNTMMVVVESLINRFEEDQLRKEEMHRESQTEQSNSHYDNCSDSDSSFNQVKERERGRGEGRVIELGKEREWGREGGEFH